MSSSTHETQFTLPQSSFTTRLVLLIVLISLPVIAYFGYSTYIRHQFMNTEAQTQVNTYTHLIADQYMANLHVTQNALAQLHGVFVGGDVLGCNLLDELRGNMYTSLSVIAPDGAVICATPADTQVDVPDAWLAQLNRVDGQTPAFFMDNTRFIAGYLFEGLLIVAPVNVDWIEQWLPMMSLPVYINARIVNEDGTTLAHHTNDDTTPITNNTPFFDVDLLAELSRRPDEIIRTDDVDGTSSYFGIQPIGDGSYLIISIPAGQLSTVYRDLNVISLIGLVTMVVVYVGVAWVLSRCLILNPVKAMIQRTQNLNMGDTQTRISTKSIRIAEFNTLANKINELAVNLQKRDDEIYDYTLRLQNEITEHKKTIDNLKLAVKAREDAEATGNNRLRFMGIVAHELKTPLTTIKGFARTLLADDVTWDEKNSREFISVIDEEADSMADMIEQLLDISQIDAGRLSTHMVLTDLDNIFRTAETRIETLTKHHNLIMNTPQDTLILKADPMRISQVLVNLIGNAAKYSPPQSTITVDVSIIKGKQVQINVKDEGQGIPEDQRDVLFQPFHRIDEQTRGIKGAGLGLSICKGIIEVHHGNIWMKDNYGEPGTTFSFTLPIVPKVDNITAN